MACVKAGLCVCETPEWMENFYQLFETLQGSNHVISNFAREWGMIVGPHSTKLPQSWDTGPGQPTVPAFTISIFVMGRG